MALICRAGFDWPRAIWPMRSWACLELLWERTKRARSLSLSELLPFEDLLDGGDGVGLVLLHDGVEGEELEVFVLLGLGLTWVGRFGRGSRSRERRTRRAICSLG